MKPQKSKKSQKTSTSVDPEDAEEPTDANDGASSSESEDDEEEEEDPNNNHVDTGIGEGPDGGEDDDDELDGDRESSDQAQIDEIIALAESPVDLADYERIFARKTLSKVRPPHEDLRAVPYTHKLAHIQVHSLMKKIFHSPVLREDLDALCRKHNIKPRGPIRSIPTRWNSVAMTSRRAIDLRPALDALTSKAAHNTSRGPRLLRFKLSAEEWEILEQLESILAVCLSYSICFFPC